MNQITAESKGEAQHIERFADIYAHGVLRPDIHRRLVEDLADVAGHAKIPPRYVYQSAKGICTPQELEWVAKYNQQVANGVDGLCYVGTDRTLERMMALAGVLLRNFISARVMAVHEVCAVLNDRQQIEDRVVFVPNFFVSKGQGGDIPSWKVSQLLGWLFERKAESKSTVVYVDSMSNLKLEYGKPFYDLLKESYLEIKE